MQTEDAFEDSFEELDPDSLLPGSNAGERHSFSVHAENAGERVDLFLALALPHLSRSHIQSLMDEGRILVDGRTCKRSHRVAAGETVTIEVPPPPPAEVQPESLPTEILYEDSDVLVVNKPAGMIVHPGAGAETGTLVAALLHRFGNQSLSTVGGLLRPGIVHRLDKGTSGAILIARNDLAHKKLVEDFRDRRIEKDYVALLHGRLKGESGTIELPISRDLLRRSRMTARRREGRPARTDWRVALRLEAFTLIAADLLTGRTHQIRVHFSALSCPVVGDTVYGAPRVERVNSQLLPPLGRNFLHSANVAFDHPRTGKRVEVHAPLPNELSAYIYNLGEALKIDRRVIDAALREFL
jgi:23S rRNA pseudouridine1911/1915/1917 synthase